jgi:hypothetical protein
MNLPDLPDNIRAMLGAPEGEEREYLAVANILARWSVNEDGSYVLDAAYGDLRAAFLSDRRNHFSDFGGAVVYRAEPEGALVSRPLNLDASDKGDTCV